MRSNKVTLDMLYRKLNDVMLDIAVLKQQMAVVNPTGVTISTEEMNKQKRISYLQNLDKTYMEG